MVGLIIYLCMQTSKVIKDASGRPTYKISCILAAFKVEFQP